MLDQTFAALVDMIVLLSVSKSTLYRKPPVLLRGSFALTKKSHLPKFKVLLMISDIAYSWPHRMVGFAGRDQS
jgi:hypothetical protein